MGRMRRRSWRSLRLSSASYKAHEGGLGRQGGKSSRELAHGRLALRPHNLRVWVVGQYGAHHEGTGTSGQLYDLLYGVQKDHGGESQAFHHDRAQEEGIG